MNYLTELLAFYRWLEVGRLGPLLQSFWHLLMFFNNKAAVRSEDGRWYWPVVFKVPNSEVCRFLGLTSRFQVNAQRKHLIRHGRIDYTPHVSQHAGDYRMKPFDTGLCETEISVMDTGQKRLVWTQGITRDAHPAAPFINGVNSKPCYPYGSIPEALPASNGFNLLPQLTEAEKAAIASLYPEDEVACFNAMWAARERKQKEKR
ncbi:restriction endonuclease subunit S [Eubacterium limosum]|uniref:Restriction endonuclease subunit S n=1 Tax=Eubacterium limosum TaxID=1736 RepID=A0ABT5UQG4_EUBLI|nr:restriction endonuclease subunit S [Eubacterium limosum]MCB6570509.1 restriction endonuclease subunit S [Eubacterium limosum]MDE1471181.1 restriction endonuclease subunit S [Eubacterium limosum]